MVRRKNELEAVVCSLATSAQRATRAGPSSNDSLIPGKSVCEWNGNHE